MQFVSIHFTSAATLAGAVWTLGEIKTLSLERASDCLSNKMSLINGYFLVFASGLVRVSNEKMPKFTQPFEDIEEYLQLRLVPLTRTNRKCP